LGQCITWVPCQPDAAKPRAPAHPTSPSCPSPIDLALSPAPSLLWTQTARETLPSLSLLPVHARLARCRRLSALISHLDHPPVHPSPICDARRPPTTDGRITVDTTMLAAPRSISVTKNANSWASRPPPLHPCTYKPLPELSCTHATEQRNGISVEQLAGATGRDRACQAAHPRRSTSLQNPSPCL
jgi:hypothetical protein